MSGEGGRRTRISGFILAGAVASQWSASPTGRDTSQIAKPLVQDEQGSRSWLPLSTANLHMYQTKSKPAWFDKTCHARHTDGDNIVHLDSFRKKLPQIGISLSILRSSF